MREGYAELLEDAGLKAQARAPMTPVVKLVFGSGYDKGRLTEYAAALSWARRQDLPAGALRERLEERGPQGPRPGRTPGPPPRARGRTPATPPAPRFAPPVRSAMSTFPARPSSSSSSPAATRSAASPCSAPVADEAMLERAIRKAAA